MQVKVFEEKMSCGAAAAACVIDGIRRALDKRGQAFVIVATGASQFEMLEHLVAAPDLDWSRVTAFHLDEYIGLPETHPASFRKYLKERFVERLPSLRRFHYCAGDTGDPQAECGRLNALIGAVEIDVACVGIGENGHLAFNDPPADFEIEAPYIIVDLDEACRRQQLGEGWFPTLEDVPRQAISMSIRQIMKSRRIVCTVPDQRKAQALQGAVEGPVSNLCPSSILQQHDDCHIFLDRPAASLLARHA